MPLNRETKPNHKYVGHYCEGGSGENILTAFVGGVSLGRAAWRRCQGSPALTSRDRSGTSLREPSFRF